MKSKYKELVHSVPNSDCVFKYIEVSRGTSLPIWLTGQNTLLFVLEGKMKIVCQDTICRDVPGGSFMMIPKHHDWQGLAWQDSRLLILLFNMVDNVWTKPKIKTLLDAVEKQSVESYLVLPVKSPLQIFLNLMVIYSEERDIDRIFYASKDNELLSILYTFYPAGELGSMFYPLLTTNLNFKNFVLANYKKVETVGELAELAGCSQVTLNRKFKEYFNDSAYQWMIKNKMILIRKRLQNPTASLADIAREFGFYSGSELNRFCQRQFGTTALKIRKQALKTELKNS